MHLQLTRRGDYAVRAALPGFEGEPRRAEADSARVWFENGQPTDTELRRDVVLHAEGVVAKGHRARMTSPAGITMLHGDPTGPGRATLVSDRGRISCDQVQMFDREGRIEARGDVQASGDDQLEIVVAEDDVDFAGEAFGQMRDDERRNQIAAVQQDLGVALVAGQGLGVLVVGHGLGGVDVPRELVVRFDPFFDEIDLTSRGVRWLQPAVDCAHPLDDGTAGVMYRSIDATADALGDDGQPYSLKVDLNDSLQANDVVIVKEGLF